MQRVLAIAALLLVTSLVLGATVFRAEVARAAQAILPVLVTNNASQPVPVREQGTPTVGINPSANGVTSADTTRTLFDQTVTGANFSGDIDTANAKQIRLFIWVLPGSCVSLDGALIQGKDASGEFIGLVARARPEPGFCHLSYLIDLPPPKIRIVLEGSMSGTLSWRLVVIGRSN